MARRSNEAPENLFGLTDPVVLDRIAGNLALQRLGELENGPLLTEFARESLQSTHHYLMQDIYPWAGQIRTEEVGASTPQKPTPPATSAQRRLPLISSRGSHPGSIRA